VRLCITSAFCIKSLIDSGLAGEQHQGEATIILEAFLLVLLAPRTLLLYHDKIG